MERLADEAEQQLALAGLPQAGRLTEIASAWAAIVGDAIARNSSPRRFGRDGTLHVATVSATWAYELDRLGPDVLARLRATLGADAPVALRFAPGPVPEPPAPEKPPGPVDAQPMSAVDRREARELAAAISDTELRSLVARAVAASLARSRVDRRFW
jgi:hypothetical protein